MDTASSPVIHVEEPTARAVGSDTTAMFARMAAALDGRRDGLPLSELRQALGISTVELRVAIEAALRAKVIRRTGSHNTLRYLSNGGRAL